MLPSTMLAGPGLPEEAFMFEVRDLYNQLPETEKETVPMKKIDLERSVSTINFMQELAGKQDELLVSVIKIIHGIEVGQSKGGSPAWDTVKESVSRDYDNIVAFCQAGLDKLTKDFPTEEENDDKPSATGSGGQAVQDVPMGPDGEAEESRAADKNINKKR